MLLITCLKSEVKRFFFGERELTFTSLYVVTLNDLERRDGPCFALFYRIW